MHECFQIFRKIIDSPDMATVRAVVVPAVALAVDSMERSSVPAVPVVRVREKAAVMEVVRATVLELMVR